MNNEILIRLFESKDRKRRKILYSLYQEYFEPGLSSIFISDTINRDLGRPNLVSTEDIKYCRFYFHKRNKSPLKIRSPVSSRKPEEKKPSSNTSIQWSDPDEMEVNQSQIIKSKFSNK